MELMQTILTFPKVPGKTCKGAAQAESLRKGEQPLHETEKKIARLHAHIARQRKDYLHKESRKITNFYDLVCIESLNMKKK